MTIWIGVIFLIAAPASASGKRCIAPVYCTEASGPYPGWMQVYPALQCDSDSKCASIQGEPKIYENSEIPFINVTELKAELLNMSQSNAILLEKFENLTAMVELLNDSNTKLKEKNDRLEAIVFKIGKVRLVNGSSFKNGRVEVLYNGTWGTVCDDGWIGSRGEHNADVVCKQLGFRRSTWNKENGDLDLRYGTGTGKIWLDNVICTGSESVISYCYHAPWGTHNCRHDEDVAVECE